MEQHEQPASGRLLGEAAVERDHPLVVAVEEVDLDAGDAPLPEAVEGRPELALQRLREAPDEDGDALAARVLDERGHVELGVQREEIVRVGPHPVDVDVGEAVAGREVHVVAVGLLVAPGGEVDALQVPVRPVVPHHLARPDPGEVGARRRRRREPRHHVARQQVRVAARQHEGAPGQAARAGRLRDVVGALGRDEVELLEAARRILEHAPREDRRELARVAVAVAQVERRVVVEVRLQQGELGAAVELEDEGQRRRERLLVPAAERRDRLVPPQALVAVVRAGAGQEEGGRLRGKGEREALVADAHAPGQSELPAQREAVVVRPRPQRRAVRQDERQLAAGVAHAGALAEGRRDRLVDRSPLDPQQPRAAAQHPPVGEGQGQRRGRQQRPAVEGERVAQLVAQCERRRESPVGRGELLAGGRGRRGSRGRAGGRGGEQGEAGERRVKDGQASGHGSSCSIEMACRATPAHSSLHAAAPGMSR